MLGITVASLTKTTTTDDLFLIPEGFEGDIQVNYNVAGAPRLAKEGKYDVIPIREDGTYDTSNPDMEYGTVTDQYFYVGQDGMRTPIPENCIHVKGNGASEIGSNITRHQYLKVTLRRAAKISGSGKKKRTGRAESAVPRKRRQRPRFGISFSEGTYVLDNKRLPRGGRRF